MAAAETTPRTYKLALQLDPEALLNQMLRMLGSPGYAPVLYFSPESPSGINGQMLRLSVRIRAVEGNPSRGYAIRGQVIEKSEVGLQGSKDYTPAPGGGEIISIILAADKLTDPDYFHVATVI